MAWTQTARHLTIASEHIDIGTCLIHDAHLIESLLGADLPKSVWDTPELMPNPAHYPSPYLGDTTAHHWQTRSQQLYLGSRYRLTLLSETAGLNIQDWIGKTITLHWHTGDPLTPTQHRHSIITAADALGSNQGMAAYRITCEPALHTLRLTSHNRRHHHLSLSDLIYDILSPHHIDIELSDALNHIHIQHSVQYNQTDLAYLTEHLTRHGITGYYQHHSDKHTLHLLPFDSPFLYPEPADILSTLSQNPAHLADTQDRITRLSANTAHHSGQTDYQRYDNRLMAHHSGHAQTQTLHKHPSRQTHFLHSHTRMNDDQLADLATRTQHAHDSQAVLADLEGNLRHLHIPSNHHITGNPYLDQPITLTAIHHHIMGNLPINWQGVTQRDPITGQLTTPSDTVDNPSELTHHIHANYLPYPFKAVPYHQDLNRLGEPHPSLTGLMSASIIAADGQTLTQDRNHRTHIRYHWQNTESVDSGSDTQHWVPIASHLVADHMGQIHPLRHGQHVLVDFIGGDITQPIIIGSVHNGQGQPDAVGNQHQSDTDALDATSPIWFKNPSHAHPIDGIKTQSIDTSRTGDANKDSGTNGYNQLMFDQHPDAPQIQAYSTAAQSSLSLGQLHQHTDHQRGTPRGQGISLETHGAHTSQAAQGMHLTSHPLHRMSDTSNHMSHNSHSSLQTADSHQRVLTQLADTHKPVGLNNSQSQQSHKDNNKNQADKPTTPYQSVSDDTCEQTLTDTGHYAKPHLLISSASQLGAVSGSHHQHTATKNSHSHATEHTHQHSQTQLNQLAAGDIHYYSNKAQTHTAAHGDVSIHAHQSQMRLDGEKTVRIHSRDSIEIIAPDTLSLTAGGSGIQMSGGNVTFITPKQVGYKASQLVWGSGGGGEASLKLQQMQFEACEKLAEQAEDNHAASTNL